MADFHFDEGVAEPTSYALAGRGHEVFTARPLRSKGIDDARQLLLAVRFGRIFVTYNAADFRLLHRAWRLWSHEWGVSGVAHHAGILILLQPPRLAADRAAELLDQFVRRENDIANRLFVWETTVGWHATG